MAAHWASRNPNRCLGAVLVDGAYPYDWLDEAEEKRIRKLFRQLNWFMPLLPPTGLAPRMTAEQQANSNIEIGVVSRERELGPVLDRITVPVRYVVASGTSFGSRSDEEERRCRLSIDAVAARTPNIQVSAKNKAQVDSSGDLSQTSFLGYCHLAALQVLWPPACNLVRRSERDFMY